MAFKDSIIEEEVQIALKALESMCKRLGLEPASDNLELPKKESTANEDCQTEAA